MSAPMVEERRSSRSSQAIVHVALAALCWIPLLLTAPGRVAADTRQHLHLDAGEFIARARSVWDPLVHMGTVTHQNIGLLFPMGAWSWLVDVSGMPVWVGQRLWVGAILFAAAAGVLHLGRTLGWALPGTTATAVVYALSPYVLQYATRTSVLLLPFAGLPWLLSLVIRAERTGGWRHPAAFALVVGVVGSVNPTSLILVGLAPVLWLVVAVATSGLTLRRGLLTAARIGLLCIGTSAWWIASLSVQSRHGLPVLTYTETIGQVATTSAATEVLRGLGYWVFYGREVLDANVGAAAAYLRHPALLALSYLLPALGLLAAFVVRFRHRGFFVAMTVVGFFVAIGAYPIDDPSIASSLFEQATETTAGLAMRSSTRAVPLVALGLAVCLGRGVDALGARVAGRWQLAGMTAVAAVLALPALVTGGFVDEHFSRPEQLPEHWTDAAAFFEDLPEQGAILELPGIQFATYRWGTTYEPVSPALFDQPVIAREQLPYGSPPSADLLIALDRRLQEGVIEPEALAPVARLMGAHWVLLRHDLAYERYLSARPERIRDALSPLPDGLEVAATFGDGYRNEPDERLPLLDEEALSLPVDPSTHPALEVLRVAEPLERVRTAPIAGATILAGDGEGIVDLAAAGLLRRGAPVLYGATVLARPDVLTEALDAGAELVVTDTARKRERRWRSVRWATGYTERADETSSAPELGDGELEIFDDVPADARSTMVQRGVQVDASAYGGPYTLDPDVRPALAVDGRLDTAWVVGPVSDPVGSRLHVAPDEPVATDEISVTQTPPSDGGNRITRLSVRVDGADPVAVDLDDRSLTPEGQPISVGDGGPVSEVEMEIQATEVAPVDGGGPVGIAELRIGDARIDEVVALPTALLDEVGSRARRAPLTFVLTRLRSDPTEPVRGDEERDLRRQLEVPTPRTFELEGTARLDHAAPSDLVDELLGLTGPRARASSTLPGNLRSRAGAAVDADPRSAWRPAFRDLEGSWIEVETDSPVRLDTLDLDIVADPDHSLPVQLELRADDVTQVVDVPPVERSPERGAVHSVSIPLEPVTGSQFRITVRAAEARSTTDYYTRDPIATPIGIAEIRLPGIERQEPMPIDTGCRGDLVTLDGQPVPVRITGSADAALDGRALDLRGCDDITLEAGVHEVRTAATSAIEVDRLVLHSPAVDPVARAEQPAPEVSDVRHRSPTTIEAEVGSGDEAWLVLAQSHGDAWEATLDGRDLGSPVLIDGGFNGWRLPAGAEGRVLEIEWRPQRTVDRAIVATLLAALLALVLVLVPRRKAPLPLDRPARPRLRGATEPLGWRPAMALLALVPALVGLLVIGPLAAAVAGAATIVSLRHRHGRLAVTVVAIGAWLAAAGWVVARQVLDPRPADFEWAATLHTPHRLAVLTVVLLVATAAADWYRSSLPTHHRREPT